MLELHGCVGAIDATGGPREIAQQITQGGADYALALKENQGQLREGIRDLFEGAAALGFDGAPRPTTTFKPLNAGGDENYLLKVLLGYDAIALGTKAVRRPQALNQWYYADCIVGRNPTCR